MVKLCISFAHSILHSTLHSIRLHIQHAKSLITDRTAKHYQTVSLHKPLQDILPSLSSNNLTPFYLFLNHKGFKEFIGPVMVNIIGAPSSLS